MKNQISEALNSLVEDVTVPDIDRLIKQETKFERTGHSLTKQHLSKCEDIFLSNNATQEDYDVDVQEMDLVIRFGEFINIREVVDDCHWIVRSVYGVNFVQAPCLVISKSSAPRLLSLYAGLSEDPELTTANQAKRLRVPVKVLFERMKKERCSREVQDMFIKGNYNMVTVMFKSVDKDYIATPLAHDQSCPPLIDDFTFGLTT